MRHHVASLTHVDGTRPKRTTVDYALNVRKCCQFWVPPVNFIICSRTWLFTTANRSLDVPGGALQYIRTQLKSPIEPIIIFPNFPLCRGIVTLHVCYTSVHVWMKCFWGHNMGIHSNINHEYWRCSAWHLLEEACWQYYEQGRRKSVVCDMPAGWSLTHWGRATHSCVGNLTII